MAYFSTDKERRLGFGNYSDIKRPNCHPVFGKTEVGHQGGNPHHIEVDEEAKEITLKPITREYVHSLRGKFKGKGLLKTLMLKETETDYRLPLA